MASTGSAVAVCAAEPAVVQPSTLDHMSTPNQSAIAIIFARLAASRSFLITACICQCHAGRRPGGIIRHSLWLCRSFNSRWHCWLGCQPLSHTNNLRFISSVLCQFGHTSIFKVHTGFHLLWLFSIPGVLAGFFGVLLPFYRCKVSPNQEGQQFLEYKKKHESKTHDVPRNKPPEPHALRVDDQIELFRAQVAGRPSFKRCQWNGGRRDLNPR